MTSRKLSLRERVRCLFFGEVEQEREVVAVVAHLPAPPTPPPLELAPGARLSVVALADVRERLGERWERFAERVHDLAEAVIRRHLTRGDVFDRHGDDGYMILFAQLGPAEARFKCQVIAKEIAAKLLGADWAGGASVEGSTFELSPDALDAEDFEAAVDRAVAAGTPVIRIDGPQYAAPPPEAPERPLNPLQASPAKTRRSGPPYGPVWDFGIGALLHFRAGGGPSSYAEPASPLAAAKTDIAGLARTLFEISQMAAEGRRLPVICPVALSTVRDDALRTQLVRVLRQADPAIRKLVVLEIVAPLGVRAIWPTAFTPDRRNLPAAATLRLGLGSDPRRIALTGIAQITLELPRDVLPDKKTLAAMDLFAQCCLECRLPFGVMGLRSRPMALAATAGGFRQLAGAAIHPDVDELGRAVRFDLASLYADLAPRAVSLSPSAAPPP